MTLYKFDGCMYNLRGQHGKAKDKLLRKPWTIACTTSAFVDMCKVCCHDPCDHARVEGVDTRLSEGYTDELVDNMHFCWFNHVST